MTVQLALDGLSVCSGVFLHPVRNPNGDTTCRFNASRVVVIMRVTPQLETLIMTRFLFLVLERHRVVAPISARLLAASVPAL
jgi:hypothetical protein